jgi:hypothetical protein
MKLCVSIIEGQKRIISWASPYVPHGCTLIVIPAKAGIQGALRWAGFPPKACGNDDLIVGADVFFLPGT